MPRPPPQRARAEGNVQVVGDKELRRALRGMEQAVAKTLLAEALEAGGAIVVEKAKELAPRSGTDDVLAKSIMYEPHTGTDQVHEGHVGPSSGRRAEFDAFYGFFQEFGTVHHGAKEFMYPAAEAVKVEAQNRMAEVVMAALHKAVT